MDVARKIINGLLVVYEWAVLSGVAVIVLLIAIVGGEISIKINWYNIPLAWNATKQYTGLSTHDLLFIIVVALAFIAAVFGYFKTK